MSVGGELQRLLDSGEYWSCLARGRDLLVSQSLPDAERLRVLMVLSRCHLALGQTPGAATAGQKAAAMARRLGLPDQEGAALLDQATALLSLGRHREALTALDRFRERLPEYTASQCLEGAAAQQTALALAGLGQTVEAVEWYQKARRWFDRFGDESSAGECFLGILEACLAAGEDAPRWRSEARRWLAEGEGLPTALRDDPDYTGALLLARARLCRLEGEYQAAVDEGFRALTLAGEFSPLQVQAQLHLSRTARQMERPVDALSFAFAARTAAIDGRLYSLEFEASAHLMRLIRQYGMEPVEELNAELERQGVDLYQYLDQAEVQRLARGE